MATQAVSSSSIYQELQSFYQSRQSDMQELSEALQSGDLSTAQQAYSQLVSLGQSGPFQNTEPFGNSSRAQDFEAIGQALSSGDLAGAQTAFAELQQTFGQSNSSSASTTPAYTVNLGTSQSEASGDTDANDISEIVINIGGSDSSTQQSTNGSELVLNLPSPSSTSSPEEVQINFGGSNGSADQLTVQVGENQDQSGTSGDEVTINLGQAYNNELILNLFANGSSSQSSTQSSSLDVQG